MVLHIAFDLALQVGEGCSVCELTLDNHDNVLEDFSKLAVTVTQTDHIGILREHGRGQQWQRIHLQMYMLVCEMKAATIIPP